MSNTKFTCPICGESGNLRKRTERATYSERIGLTDEGQVWDYTDMELESEGPISFHCGHCGYELPGITDEEDLQNWLQSIKSRHTLKKVTLYVP